MGPLLLLRGASIDITIAIAIGGAFFMPLLLPLPFPGPTATAGATATAAATATLRGLLAFTLASALACGKEPWWSILVALPDIHLAFKRWFWW